MHGKNLAVTVIAVGLGVAVVLWLLLRKRGGSAGASVRRWSWGSGGGGREVALAVTLNDDYALAAVERAADGSRGELAKAAREITLALARERKAVTRLAWRAGPALEASTSTSTSTPREFCVTLAVSYSGAALEPPADGEALAKALTTLGALGEGALWGMALTTRGPAIAGMLALDGRAGSRVACAACGVVVDVAAGRCAYCGREIAA